MKKRVAIISAGPAGITAGYEISKNENFSTNISKDLLNCCFIDNAN